MLALDKGIASPKELAARLGIPIPNVSYHVGILRDPGLIRVVRETPRRGAVERHCNATAQALTLRQVIDWLLVAEESRPRRWTARVTELDAGGVTDVDAALTRLWNDLDEIHGQAARRSRRKGVGAG